MAERNSTFKQRVYNFFLRFGVFCAYITLGMVIIVAIEKTDSDEKQRKSKLLSDLQIDMTLKYNLTRKEFDLLADAIYDAKSPGPLQWTYGQGFSFVTQLVTTIGYGNITPVTDGGKVFTMFFALFGIPITILMLSTVGEEMLNCQKYVIKKVETGWLNRSDVSYLEVKCLITSFAIILLVVLVGAVTTDRQYQDWSFLDSFYCWFITFTTVGFGDFIPFHRMADLKLTAFAIYILFGLCAMANLLNIVGEFASSGIFKIQRVNTDDKVEVDAKENQVNAKTHVTSL